jgi:hypothetical protein
MLGLFLFPLFATAQKEKKISLQDLPQQAQTFIKTNLTKAKAQQVLKETESALEVAYKVTFQDRLKVKFDKNGNWKEVNGNRRPIPTEFIPERILQYIRKRFPNNEVVKIEKEKRSFEVEITNGLELEFDKEGKFVKIDS